MASNYRHSGLRHRMPPPPTTLTALAGSPFQALGTFSDQSTEAIETDEDYARPEHRHIKASLDASTLAEIEDFLLNLPLGTDQAAATIEQLVAQRLIDDALAKKQLTRKLQQWSQVAMDLQSMVQQQQRRIQQLNQQLARQQSTSQEQALHLRNKLLPSVAAQAAAMTAQMLGVPNSAKQTPMLSGTSTPITPANHRMSQNSTAQIIPDTAQLKAIQNAIKSIVFTPGGESNVGSKQGGVLRGSDGGRGLDMTGLTSHAMNSITSHGGDGSSVRGSTSQSAIVHMTPLDRHNMVQALQSELQDTKSLLSEQQMLAVRAADEAGRLRAALMDAEMDMQRMEQERTAASERAQEAQDSLAEAQSKVTQLTATLDSHRSNHAIQIGELQQQLVERGQRLQESNEQLAVATQRLEALQNTSADVQKQLAESKKKCDELGEKLGGLQQALQHANQLLAETSKESAEASALRVEVEQIRGDLATKIEELASARNECARLQEQLAATDAAHMKLEGVCGELRHQLKHATVEQSRMQAELHSTKATSLRLQEKEQLLQQKVVRMETDIRGLNESLKETEATKASSEEAAQKLLNSMEAMQSELNHARQQAEEWQGKCSEAQLHIQSMSQHSGQQQAHLVELESQLATAITKLQAAESTVHANEQAMMMLESSQVDHKQRLASAEAAFEHAALEVQAARNRAEAAEEALSALKQQQQETVQHAIAALQTEIQELEANLQQSQEHNKQLLVEVESSKALQQSHAEQEQELARLRELRDDQASQIKDLQAQLTALEASAVDLQQQLAHSLSELQSVQNQLESVQLQKQRLEASIAVKDAMLFQVQDALEKLNCIPDGSGIVDRNVNNPNDHSFNHTLLSGHVGPAEPDQMQSVWESLQQKLASQQKQCDMLAEKKAQYMQQVSELQLSLDKAIVEHAMTQEHVRRLETELESAHAALRQEQGETTRLNEQVQALEELCQSQEEQLDAAFQELNDARMQVTVATTTLKSMRQETDGEIDRLRNKLNLSKETTRSLKGQNANLTRQLKQQYEQLQQCQDELAESAHMVEQIKARLETATFSAQEADKQLADLKKEMDQKVLCAETISRHQAERIAQLEEEVEELSTRIIVMTHAGHDPAETQQGSGVPSTSSPAGHVPRLATSKEVLLQEEVSHLRGLVRSLEHALLSRQQRLDAAQAAADLAVEQLEVLRSTSRTTRSQGLGSELKLHSPRYLSYTPVSGNVITSSFNVAPVSTQTKPQSHRRHSNTGNGNAIVPYRPDVTADMPVQAQFEDAATPKDASQTQLQRSLFSTPNTRCCSTLVTPSSLSSVPPNFTFSCYTTPTKAGTAAVRHQFASPQHALLSNHANHEGLDDAYDQPGVDVDTVIETDMPMTVSVTVEGPVSPHKLANIAKEEHYVTAVSAVKNPYGESAAVLFEAAPSQTTMNDADDVTSYDLHANSELVSDDSQHLTLGRHMLIPETLAGFGSNIGNIQTRQQPAEELGGDLNVAEKQPYETHTVFPSPQKEKPSTPSVRTSVTSTPLSALKTAISRRMQAAMRQTDRDIKRSSAKVSALQQTLEKLIDHTPKTAPVSPASSYTPSKAAVLEGRQQGRQGNDVRNSQDQVVGDRQHGGKGQSTNNTRMSAPDMDMGFKHTNELFESDMLSQASSYDHEPLQPKARVATHKNATAASVPTKTAPSRNLRKGYAEMGASRAARQQPLASSSPAASQTTPLSQLRKQAKPEQDIPDGGLPSATVVLQNSNKHVGETNGQGRYQALPAAKQSSRNDSGQLAKIQAGSKPLPYWAMFDSDSTLDSDFLR